MDNILGLVATCLKVGALTPGGMAGLIPVLAHELVKRGGWLSREEFLYGLALCEGTPGPAVMGMAIAGIKWAGFLGGLLVALALVVPGLLWLAVLLQFSQRASKIRQVVAGVQPAVPGLLMWLAWRLMPAGTLSVGTALIAGLTCWLVLRWRVASAWLLLGAVVIGWAAV